MAKHRVLVVEDEPDIAGLITHTLERGADAETEVVGTGDATLKAVAERPPDLVILDLNLPVLSGLEVCRILRGRWDAKHLPIIMLTARTTEDDCVGGLELGADDYLTKPFSLRELAARVRAVLRRSRAVQERPPEGYRGRELDPALNSAPRSFNPWRNRRRVSRTTRATCRPFTSSSSRCCSSTC